MLQNPENPRPARGFSLDPDHLFDTTEWRRCPRCLHLFCWPDEYIEHAWHEKL